MDYALNDDQRAIQDAARAFAEAELAPHSARWDEDKHFPVEVMKQAAEMGFCGIYTAEEHGGMALGRGRTATVNFESTYDFEREGWTVVETYSDRAISGSSMFRAGIRSLLADAQAGRFDIREHLPGGKNRPGKPGKQQEEDNPPAHRDPAI